MSYVVCFDIYITFCEFFLIRIMSFVLLCTAMCLYIYFFYKLRLILLFNQEKIGVFAPFIPSKQKILIEFHGQLEEIRVI